MTNTLYSFDIFDTCLGRICGESKNIFYLLAKKILGSTADQSRLNDFVYIRVNAEILARKQKTREDITLADIYNIADFSSFTDIPNDSICALELELERENLFPIYSMLNKIKKLHNKNKSVIYISDMYLPAKFLIEILESNGFWKDGDRIYVSSEIGLTKSSGHLYNHVRKIEKPFIGKWIHSGDNKWSDFIIPLAKGIRCNLIKTGYSKYQLLTKNLNFKSSVPTVCLAPAISRSISLELGNNEKIKFASDLIAPIYVPFVYNILKDANKRRLKRLYFLSRDGYILFEIAKCFKKLFPEIGIYYLHVSRKSLYLPGILNFNKESLSELLIYANNNNIRETLDNFQIEFNDSEIQLLSKYDDIVNGIFSNPSILEKIKFRWESQKKLCIEYLIQEKVASKDSNVGIIDLRGTRKSQIAINKLLLANGFSPVYAYYLEVTDKRLIGKDTYYSQYYMETVKNSNTYKGLYYGKYILEHYFSITPFRRCAGYEYKDGRINPIFDDEEILSLEAEKCTYININCSKEFARRMILMDALQNSDEIINCSLAILSSFILKPDKSYLRALLNINMSQTQYKERLLVKYVHLSDFFSKKIAWYEGSVKLTYGQLGLTLFNFFKKTCNQFRIFI